MTVLLQITWQGIAAGLSFFIICLVLLYLFLVRGNEDNLCNYNSRSTDKFPLNSADYSLFTDRLMRVHRKFKTILFAAARLNDLPVTIPCNTAIKLAESGKKCLLIDTDIKRDSVARAFGLDSYTTENSDHPKQYETPFENLYVWPARNFTKISSADLAKIIQNASGEFDFILINVPSIDNTAVRKQASVLSDAAFIFAADSKNISTLSSAMKSSECKVIGNIIISR